MTIGQPGAQVKIWNLLPVVDVQQEVNPVTPKLLATLADHYSPVNIARFSRDGRRLASGATCMDTLRVLPAPLLC
jgi:WD40 repeat protein